MQCSIAENRVEDEVARLVPVRDGQRLSDVRAAPICAALLSTPIT
jgi:hypothetical protein